ncbi:GNAT family N-acetyltransferase [Marinomonas posidonica]|nr:GNAT family N-acetyltransferase [Marinomonas posidonica]
MLLTLGKGFVGCDPIGRIVASGMWFPIGSDFTTIGMVITSPRLQALGGGRWMMKHVMAQCEDRDIVLSSTKAGYRLYTSLSFQPVSTIFQYQGIATSIDPSHLVVNESVRQLEPKDTESILQLDKSTFGTDRSNIIKTVLEKSQGSVLVRNNKILGFALCRKFGRGHVIGPVVAQNSADAIALIAPHVNQHAGQFLRIDTAEQDKLFTDFLNTSGMQEFDTVTAMTNKPLKKAESEFHSFALVSQALA